MKKTIAIIILTMLALTLSVSAHPGKTDKYGGHYDNSTGEYHYHHGYPAHEHINGVCPYDFDDKTNHQSGTSSTSTATHKPENHVETPDPMSPTLDEMNSIQTSNANMVKRNYKAVGGAGIAVVLIGLIVSGIYSERKKKNTEPTVTEQKEELPPPPTPVTHERQAPIPDGVGIDDDLLPYRLNRTYGYGKEYNVFVTPKSKYYHTSRCKFVKGRNKTVIHRYVARQNLPPCPNCIREKKKGVDDWYKKAFPNSTWINKDFEQLSLFDK